MKKTCKVILLSLMLGWVFTGYTEELPPAKRDASPYRVAILSFQNRSGNAKLNQYAHTISSALMSDMCSVNGIVALERSEVADALAEVRLGKDGFLDPKSLPQDKKVLDADYLIEGVLKQDNDSLSVTYTVFSFAKNEIISTQTTAGAPEDLFKFIQQIKDGVIKCIQPKEMPAIKGEKIKNIKLGVMPFEDLSPEGRLSGLAELAKSNCEASLSSVKMLSVLDRERLSEIMSEKQLAVSGLTETKNALKIGKTEGLNYLALGSLIFINQQARVDVRIVSVDTGRMLFNVSVTGELEKIDALGSEVAAGIVKKFELSEGLVALAGVQRPIRASKEAKFYLERAIKASRESRMAITNDETKSLQRTMYLDALDNSASICLIDQLIDSEMYLDAERQIRALLKHKLTTEEQASLWRRLADLYKVDGALPIYYHLIKNFPDTSDALEAHWRIVFGRHNNTTYPVELFVSDFRIEYESALVLDKNPDRLKEFAPRLTTALHGPVRPLAFDLEAELNLKLVSYKKTVDSINFANIDPKVLYDQLSKAVKDDRSGITQINVQEYVELLKDKKLTEAKRMLDEFLRKSPINPVLFAEFDRLINYYDYHREFPAALELAKIKYDLMKKTQERSKGGYIPNMPFANPDRINYLEEKIKIWKNCNPDNYVIPNYPVDRERQRPREMEGNFQTLSRMRNSIRMYPDDPQKAYEHLLSLARQQRVKTAPPLSKREESNLLSCMIAEYIYAGNHGAALKLFENCVPGNSISEKIKDMPTFAANALAEYFVSRMDFEKACEIFKETDKLSYLDIQLFKLHDLSKMEPHLYPGPCPRTTVPDFIKSGPRMYGSSSRQRRGGGYVVYLTAIYYEEKGDYVKAQNYFYSYLNGPAGWLPSSDETILAATREHLAAIDKIMIPETAKTFCWKVGDWWEGIQGWYLSCPEGGDIQEGWVFTPIYFEITGMRDSFGPKQFILKIYNGSRDQIKTDNNLAAKSLYATLYIDAATLATNIPEFGPACGAFKDDSNRLGNLPHREVFIQSDYGWMPVAENPLAINASVFFGPPFNANVAKTLNAQITCADDKLAVQKEPLACKKITVETPLDWMTFSYPMTAYFDENSYKRTLETVTSMRFNLEEWWNNQYPWWLRTVEKNRWYVEGKSPASAKYSKLFVLTSVNGKDISVETGLAGELANIKVLQEKYMNYAQTTPFNKNPHREMLEFLKLYHAYTLNWIKPDNSILTKYRNAAIPYFRGVSSSLQQKDPIAFQKAVRILLDVLKDEEFWTNIETMLKDSPPEQSEDRLKTLECLSSSRSSKAYDLFMEHLKRCQTNKYPQEEIEALYRQIAKLHDCRAVPFLLERYKQTKNLYFLNNAARIEQTYNRRFEEYVWTPPITVESSQENIDQLIKNLQEWAKRKMSEPAPRPGERPPRRIFQPRGF